MATIGEVQEIVNERCAALLAQAQALSEGVYTPNSDQAIAWALRMLGYAPTSLTAATDAEVQAVAAGLADALLDLAELRLLKSVQTNLTAVTVKAGPVEEDYNDLSERLAEIIKERQANATARYSQWLAIPLTGDAPKRAALRAI